jgi:hypothetical protein
MTFSTLPDAALDSAHVVDADGALEPIVVRV